MRNSRRTWKKAVASACALTGILAWSAVTYAGPVWRLNTEASFITDSDSETQYLLGVGATVLDREKREGETASVLAGSHTFTNGGSTTFGFLRLRGNYRVNDNLTLNGRFALYANDAWAPALPGATLSVRPVRDANIELFYDRELVDTLHAVLARDTVDTAGVSADYMAVRPFTVVGAYYHQFFRDGNDKDGYIAKLIFAPETSCFNTTASFKYVTSRFKSPLYFSPDSDTEFIVIEQFKRPIAGEKYVIRLRGGLGWQWISDNGFHTDKVLALAEGGLKGWVSDHFGVEVLAGYTSNSANENFSRFYSLLVLSYSF